MPVILLIRHGENEYVKTGRLAGRLPGVHLNEKGRAQAQAVADRLKGTPIKGLYSSPMERTMETAAPLAEALGMEIVPRQGLLEIDIGDWQDQKVKGLSRLKVWRTVQERPSLFRFPGGETFAQAQQRIVQELLELAGKHQPEDILACVSHADPIRLAVGYFVGLPLDQFQRLSVSPGSISILHLSESGSHLLTLNYDLSLSLAKS